MNVPENLMYTNDHEWVLLDGSKGKIGITDYAQDALGDVVFVDTPSLGELVASGQTVSEVESTKSVSGGRGRWGNPFSYYYALAFTGAKKRRLET